MGKFRDLTGMRFGRLIVIKHDGKDNYRDTYWQCLCDCGTITRVIGNSLKRGNAKSCGCLQKEINLKLRTTHGRSNNRIYYIYSSMKARCYKKQNKNFNNYGGRGISICDEWMNRFESFYEWSINNGYSEKLTIDRINNNGNYEPGNCRWTTQKIQCSNTRRNNILTCNGESMILQDWARRLNINHSTLIDRIKHNGVEIALTMQKGVQNARSSRLPKTTNSQPI